MKLPLLTIVFPFLLRLGGELLSPSSSNSVSDHKKTSLTGWLPPPTVHLRSPHPLFFLPATRFPAGVPHSTRPFKLQLASNPA